MASLFVTTVVALGPVVWQADGEAILSVRRQADHCPRSDEPADRSALRERADQAAAFTGKSAWPSKDGNARAL